MPVIDAATVFTPVTAAVPAATSTVRGTVELAVGSEFAANATNDTDATTPAYVAAAVTGRYLAQATAPTSPSAGLTWKNTSTQTVSGVGGGASAIWSGSTWSPFTFGSAKFVPNAVTTIAAAATFTPVNVALSGTPAINEDFAVASGTRVSAGAGLYLVGGQAVFTVVTGSAAASTLGQAIMAAAFRKNGTDYVGPFQNAIVTRFASSISSGLTFGIPTMQIALLNTDYLELMVKVDVDSVTFTSAFIGNNIYSFIQLNRIS